MISSKEILVSETAGTRPHGSCLSPAGLGVHGSVLFPHLGEVGVFECVGRPTEFGGDKSGTQAATRTEGEGAGLGVSWHLGAPALREGAAGGRIASAALGPGCPGFCLCALAGKHCVPLCRSGHGQSAVETRQDKDTSLQLGLLAQTRVHGFGDGNKGPLSLPLSRPGSDCSGPSTPFLCVKKTQ